MAPHTLYVGLQFLQPTSYKPPVGLDLGLSRTSGADSTTEALEVGPLSRQSRKQVLVLRKLNLEPSLTCPGSGREYVQNECRPVQDLAPAELFLEVSLLGRCQLVIADDGVDLKSTARIIEFLEFPLAQIRVRRSVYALRNSLYDHCSCSARQLC